MKIKIIQLLCLIIILGCQKNDINDIDVFNGNDTNLSKLSLSVEIRAALK